MRHRPEALPEWLVTVYDDVVCCKGYNGVRRNPEEMSRCTYKKESVLKESAVDG